MVLQTAGAICLSDSAIANGLDLTSLLQIVAIHVEIVLNRLGCLCAQEVVDLPDVFHYGVHFISAARKLLFPNLHIC